MTNPLNKYMEHLADACIAVDDLTAYLGDNGRVSPDKLNWDDVGSMASLAAMLKAAARFAGAEGVAELDENEEEE